MEKSLDFGVAFDGDGDRIGAIDGEGRVIWGDQLLMVYAEDLLARRKGVTIIADVKASRALFDHVAAHGGKPLMWKTGHSLIKSKMKETGSPLAGEMSGHVFFADTYYGFDDALYAGVRLNALNLPAFIQRIINLVMAACLLAVVVLSVWSVLALAHGGAT